MLPDEFQVKGSSWIIPQYPEYKNVKVICKNSNRVYWENSFCPSFVLPIFMQDWPDKAIWLNYLVLYNLLFQNLCFQQICDWVYDSFGFQLPHIIASLIKILLQLQNNFFFFLEICCLIKPA